MLLTLLIGVVLIVGGVFGVPWAVESTKELSQKRAAQIEQKKQEHELTPAIISMKEELELERSTLRNYREMGKLQQELDKIKKINHDISEALDSDEEFKFPEEGREILGENYNNGYNNRNRYY